MRRPDSERARRLPARWDAGKMGRRRESPAVAVEFRPKPLHPEFVMRRRLEPLFSVSRIVGVFDEPACRNGRRLETLASAGLAASGADGDRTRNLCLAKAALSQLSYGPEGQENSAGRAPGQAL